MHPMLTLLVKTRGKGKVMRILLLALPLFIVGCSTPSIYENSYQPDPDQIYDKRDNRVFNDNH